MASKNDFVIEVNALRVRYKEAYMDYFLDLIFNAIEFTGDDLPPANVAPNDYLKKTFINNGSIGYDKSTKLWLPYSITGAPNAYGLYTDIQLIGLNGYFKTAKLNEDAFVVRFSPNKTSLYEWLSLMVDDIVDLRVAIRAQAIKHQQPIVYEVDDKSNILSIKNAYNERKLGIPVVFESGHQVQNSKVNDTDYNFIIDKLIDCIHSYVNDILVRIGCVAGNADKKERVQSYDLPLDVAIDNIYTFIDTFNADCEKYGIKAQAKLNGAIEELYNPDNQPKIEEENKKPESEVKDNEE